MPRSRRVVFGAVKSVSVRWIEFDCWSTELSELVVRRVRAGVRRVLYRPSIDHSVWGAWCELDRVDVGPCNFVRHVIVAWANKALGRIIPMRHRRRQAHLDAWVLKICH